MDRSRGMENGSIVLRRGELAGTRMVRALATLKARLGTGHTRTPDGWRDRCDVRQGKADSVTNLSKYCRLDGQMIDSLGGGSWLLLKRIQPEGRGEGSRKEMREKRGAPDQAQSGERSDEAERWCGGSQQHSSDVVRSVVEVS